ncbi:three-Cys-motif partner protein TcmP [Spirosoma rhododendri]|uniref:Three-Cys-motif partner protein TcmP n=1 Tax=Spirosoma rhododendri TaxID=2728024 RepID=A0A7L5DHG8_9BACT|nr:three-Cys-motif partner protein TcmP [Spirosoma rhododendri]QJD77719.1 three-Cys-motif partner protein TcmP [Spirosoma rhododendri]
MKENIVSSQSLFGDISTSNLIVTTKKQRRKKKTSNAKKVVFPHSRAKLSLYANYLEKYLAIMSVAPKISKIHIFDIFCGTGIYNDGRVGSPILAYENILKVNTFLRGFNNTKIKDTILYVNDINKNNIHNVKQYLDEKERVEGVNIEYNNLDAQDMIERALSIIKTQDYNERNIMFLDPYGYSQIKKETIEKIMNTKKTEIILFLPASHMHRFKDVVQEEEKQAYLSLRNFLYDFFPESHPIRTINKVKKISTREFISHVCDALSMSSKFHSTSFYLQRDQSNYYALFFITNNILGLERIIDIKWDIDRKKGEGFRLNDMNQSLFDMIGVNIELEHELLKLENIVLDRLKIKKTVENIELYLIALKNNFRPTHLVKVLRKLQNISFIKAERTDGKKLNKGTFYINYDNYSTKKDVVVVSLI